jgi:hypothetical protein
MDQCYLLNMKLNRSGLTWDERYEKQPCICPTYPIWRKIVKVL